MRTNIACNLSGSISQLVDELNWQGDETGSENTDQRADEHGARDDDNVVEGAQPLLFDLDILHLKFDPGVA